MALIVSVVLISFADLANSRRLFCTQADKNHRKKYGLAYDLSERQLVERERLSNLRLFESMDRVNRAIQATNNLEQMMSDVLDVVLSIFDSDWAWLLYPCDPKAVSWRVPMERTKLEYPDALLSGQEVITTLGDVEIFDKAIADSGPVSFGPGLEHELEERGNVEYFRVYSQLVIAICPKVGKPWLFGLHQCAYPRVWGQEDKRLFQEIGRRLADALTSLLSYRNPGK